MLDCLFGYLCIDVYIYIYITIRKFSTICYFKSCASVFKLSLYSIMLSYFFHDHCGFLNHQIISNFVEVFLKSSQFLPTLLLLF